METPPAIIFLNSDINQITIDTIISQLMIHEVIAGNDFDNKVLDPSYIENIYITRTRLLVIVDANYINCYSEDGYGNHTIPTSCITDTVDKNYDITLNDPSIGFQNYNNRDMADIVLFFKHGLATVEKNNYGPHGLTLPISRINVYELLKYNKSDYVNYPEPDIYKYHPYYNVAPYKYGLGGIFAIQTRDPSGVSEPNPDNELNNEDFINRKA